MLEHFSFGEVFISNMLRIPPFPEILCWSAVVCSLVGLPQFALLQHVFSMASTGSCTNNYDLSVEASRREGQTCTKDTIHWQHCPRYPASHLLRCQIIKKRWEHGSSSGRRAKEMVAGIPALTGQGLEMHPRPKDSFRYQSLDSLGYSEGVWILIAARTAQSPLAWHSSAESSIMSSPRPR
ncbi:uncharacterized protein IWZ02DRAFT_83601 [Phyllosticta citriasiana]|uniref:uncharacterized protein n=1 Tax=Phyllosticta citriasiana TaxID=595635 RepID=UPI0030FD7E25